MKRHFRDYLFLLVIAGVVVLLDQWTKNLVRSNLDYSDIWAPYHWMIPYIRIVHWQNTGAAFGMLQGLGPVFMVLAIIVSLAILYYFPSVPKEEWLIRLAMGLQLGGAVGNLIDRLQYGPVTDFISVGTFAVFNIADASITVGTILLVLGMWLRERRLASASQDTNSANMVAQTPTASQAPDETERD